MVAVPSVLSDGVGIHLYDPALGRFLQVDPVEGVSANDYDYCGGDPINCFDLGGMAPDMTFEDFLARLASVAEFLTINWEQQVYKNRERIAVYIVTKINQDSVINPKNGKNRVEQMVLHVEDTWKPHPSPIGRLATGCAVSGTASGVIGAGSGAVAGALAGGVGAVPGAATGYATGYAYGCASGILGEGLLMLTGH